MIDEFNPYAPPKTQATLEPLAPTESGVWRDGPLLVMTKDASLPDRCLKCNQPADHFRLRRRLSWHPGYWYFLILVSLLIYIVVALIVRHTATVMVPLCEEHRRRRRRAIAVGWLLGLGSFAALFAGLSLPGETPTVIGAGVFFVLLLAGLIYGIIGSQVAVPARIDKRFVWLKKVDPTFLAELPAWPS